MPEPIAKSLFTQICLAVAHLHAQGFCHRDLKDENVILDQTVGVVRLIDLGAARAVGRAGAGPSRTRQFVEFAGSRGYISPEILRGEAYSGVEHDLWCLGILLFVLLVGVFVLFFFLLVFPS